MKIYVIGTGPGGADYICPKALKAMQESDVIVGYKTYINLVRDLLPEKEMISSGMLKEVERCENVLALAKEGKTVSLISSGDAGIYGMAGIMLEVVDADGNKVDVEVVPGISAATSAASLLGAPLMNDFVTISLSDLLTPREMIIKRLHAIGAGDFALAMYNPKSKTRTELIKEAVAILLEYKDPKTPCGVVQNAMREDQSVVTCTLDELLDQDIDMFTTLVIGNSQTRFLNGKMITRRGYKLN